MNKKECEKATEIIDRYIYTCAMAKKPTKKEVKEALTLIDKLIVEHFELVEHTTPKEVVWIFDDEPICPSCSEVIDDGNQDLCEYCGQRLDWGEY